MASFIWKPSTINSWKGGPVFLVPSGTTGTPTITVNGQTHTGRFVNDNEGRRQFVFPKELAGQNNLEVDFNGQRATLGNGATSYEGGDLNSLQARQKGSLGSTPDGSANFQSGGATGNPFGTPESTPGGFGFIPPYLGGMFPNPMFGTFNSINPAPYNMVDPMDFAKKFGEFNRGEIQKNFDLSRDLSFQQLDTELKGLEGFVPAASALKRRQTSIDNLFNQQTRLAQVEGVLPGARTDLEAQAGRARTYAAGRLPDEQQDRALELGIRSRSADLSSASGFGARSLAAGKASDLMSAERRLQIAQYGDQLTGQNIQNRANLLLSPTEYSNAGSQISAVPSVSGSQLSAQNLALTSNLTTIPTSTAFQSQINQEQFGTNIVQRTNEFNSTGQANMSQFNAGVGNQFAMSKFGYNTGYAAAVTGAYQTDLNSQIAQQQQDKNQSIFNDFLNQSQNSGLFGSLGQLLTQLPALLGQLQSLLGGGGEGNAGTNGNTGGNRGGGGSGGGGLSGTSNGGSGGGGSSGGGNLNIGGSGGGNFSGTDIPDSGGESSQPDFNLDGVPGGSSGSGGDFQPDTSDGSGFDFDNESTPNFGFDGGGTGGDFDIDTSGLDDSLGDGGFGASDADIDSFGSDAGVTDLAKKINKTEASQALRFAGLTQSPSNETQQIGYDTRGKPIYTVRKLAASTDINAGNKATTTLRSIIDPTGALSKEDASALDQIGALASDAKFLNGLNDAYQKGDKTAFASLITGRLKGPLINSLSTDKQTRAGLNTIASAGLVFANWDRMSDAQRSLAVAGIGISGYRAATGTNLANIKVPGTNGSLNVGGALSLLASGYNAYSLVNNWNQMSDIQRIEGGANTALGLAATGETLGLLGSGTAGAAGVGAASTGAGASAALTTSTAGVGAAGAGTAAAGGSGSLGGGLAASSGGSMPIAEVGAGSWAGVGGAAIGLFNGYMNYENVPNEQKATYVQQQAGLAVANYYTAGLANIAYAYGNKQWGGTLNKITNLDAKTNLFSIGLTKTGWLNDNRFMDEQNDLTKLKKEGYDVGDIHYLGKGRSKEQLIQEAEAGGDPASIAFAKSRDVKDLTPEQIQGYSSIIEQSGKEGTFQDRLNLSRDALAAGAVTEGRGQIKVDWDKVEAYRKEHPEMTGDYKFTPRPTGQNPQQDQSNVHKGSPRITNAPPAPGQSNVHKGSPEVTNAPGQSNFNRGSPDVKNAPTQRNFVKIKGAPTGSAMAVGLANMSKSNPVLYSKVVQHFSGVNNTALSKGPSSDYIAGLMGVGATRIAAGSVHKDVDAAGESIGNHILGELKGKQLNPKTFAAIQQKARATYAQGGIRSKEEALGNIKGMYHHSNLNESELVATQQAVSLVFDPTPKAFEQVTSLLNGRTVGSKITPTKQVADNTWRNVTPKAHVIKSSRTFRDKSDIVAANRAKYAGY